MWFDGAANREWSRVHDARNGHATEQVADMMQYQEYTLKTNTQNRFRTRYEYTSFFVVF